MHRNPYWLGFLACVFLATLWIGGKTAYQLMNTLNLSKTTAPTSLMLSITKKSSSAFYPTAAYSYEVDGRSYEGRSLLEELKYLRQEPLEHDLNRIRTERNWIVYYNPANPSHSSLERNMPYKNIAYSVIMVGLLGYFVWLGFIAGK